MPLVAYDPKKYNIEEFSVQCIRVFQSDGYYLTRVGLLTHAPGVMFALEHVESPSSFASAENTSANNLKTA